MATNPQNFNISLLFVLVLCVAYGENSVLRKRLVIRDSDNPFSASNDYGYEDSNTQGASSSDRNNLGGHDLGGIDSNRKEPHHKGDFGFGDSTTSIRGNDDHFRDLHDRQRFFTGHSSDQEQGRDVYYSYQDYAHTPQDYYSADHEQGRGVDFYNQAYAHSPQDYYSAGESDYQDLDNNPYEGYDWPSY